MHIESKPTCSLMVAHRDKLTTLEITFGEQPATWQLKVLPNASSAQKKHLEDWLGKEK